jgi:hypothetical protein
VPFFSGRWQKAQELYHRRAALSGKSSSYGTIAGALLGFCQSGSDDIKQALAISQINSPVQIMYVPVLANGSLCGDAGEAQKLADEQKRRYPNSTLVKVYSEPIIRAAIALQRDRADEAIEFLNAALPYEGGSAAFWPNYLRGQAYLRLRHGTQAAAEFQKFSITEDGIRLRRCIRWHISASREPLFSTGTLQKRVVLIRISLRSGKMPIGHSNSD